MAIAKQEDEKQRLTPKQQRFCEFYVENPEDMEGAIEKAGFTRSKAKEKAQALLKRPKVQKYIKKFKEKRVEKLGVDKFFIFQKKLELYEMCTGRRKVKDKKGREHFTFKPAEANKALADLAEYVGLKINKHEVKDITIRDIMAELSGKRKT